ncbi:hypothetical protein [Dactylosporangium sp. NPDC049140]|uniref:hypothetical protein n=1 Tax=Dactylosporangium sp. NPDC049140 TaxID=3155647 RepID=UPI0033CBD643
MVLIPVLLAPLVMALAALAERRAGAAAAGWVAALPVSLAVAVTAVGLTSGPHDARAMALSAAAHVPGQVAFAVALARAGGGAAVRLAAGTAAYVVCTFALLWLPMPVAVALGIPALAAGRRLVAPGMPEPGRSSSPALTCVASAAVVAGALGTAAAVGPVAAGVVAAFPAMSATLAVAVTLRGRSRAASDARTGDTLAGEQGGKRRTIRVRAAAGRVGDGETHALTCADGRGAAARQVMGGLVRSLPCYWTFALVTGVAAGTVGAAAAGVALPVAFAAGWLTWRSVPAKATITAT